MGQSFASLVPMVTAAEFAIRLAFFVITFQVSEGIVVEIESINSRLSMTPRELPKYKVLYAFHPILSFSFWLQVYCHAYCSATVHMNFSQLVDKFDIFSPRLQP